MALRIYNTLSGRKEEFKPFTPGQVGMYVCGVTVYDFCHIGHARAYVAFDLVYRYFKRKGFKINYVRNFTDIDDKIINRANEQGVSTAELSRRFIDEFYRDTDALYIQRPDVEPRATEVIPEIIRLTETLMAKGYAYQAEGDVYFRVRNFRGYGKLSKRNIEDLMSGARVEPGEKKEDPLDFALWKASKPGEPVWESPWGEGRPGWHIECSAMSQKFLGETIDIHGGGKDLIFPHHENEIAQSEAASGKPFVRYFMHNGFITINQEKMSKSLKNFFTIREILAENHPEALRLFLLSKHYRSPLDFSPESLREARLNLDRLYRLLQDLEMKSGPGGGDYNPAEQEAAALLEQLPAKVDEALEDDFNSAEALGYIFDAVRNLNRLLAGESGLSPAAPRLFNRAHEVFLALGDMLGLFNHSPAEYFAAQKAALLKEEAVAPEEIERLIAERTQARREKNFKRADEIRKLLLEKKIILEDGPQGTSWRSAD